MKFYCRGPFNFSFFKFLYSQWNVSVFLYIRPTIVLRRVCAPHHILILQFSSKWVVLRSLVNRFYTSDHVLHFFSIFSRACVCKTGGFNIVFKNTELQFGFV